ncbi:cytochrome C oxidase subunit II [Halalkalibacillus sediminis]|uniref:Cytochrome C oxidase subunit II n=1 Tax=Halalkalibacillus sediminis TaxID=2018042 RepID=A0A2I0QQN6_9BACI|nr:cytochrome C oxidase subunit II [Halalkalibacillus sediminis]PKR76645.1 cytochrome C oxidase subunit II [Halalkalibacillus sediminis]
MKKSIFSILIISLLMVLAACGGGDSSEGDSSEDSSSGDNTTEETDSSSEEADSTLDIAATDFKFDKENYTASAGEVTVNLTNEEGKHGVQIQGTDLNLQEEGSGTVNLEPGEYKINCSVPCGEGHSDMVATLTVK